ncbi:hypothetical protein KR067_003950 [Drosophila pandora]|nr:hypothetical protein KR067_003950 [Drosophila pandora]
MLRHCLANVDFARLHAQQQLQPKCGEIFYEQEANSFQLVCLLCEMKHFAFEDFARHIRNVHFDSQGRPLTEMVTAVRQDNLVLTKTEMQVEYLSGGEEEPDLEEGSPLRVMVVDENQSEEDEDTSHVLWEQVERLSPHSESISSNLDDENMSSYSFEKSHEEEEDLPQSVFKKMKQRQPKDYNCVHCNRKYTTQKYLNTHLRMSHPHPQAFKCDVCGATFDVDRALEQHRRKEHTEFECKICAKVFKSSRSLLRHVQGHSGLRQFKCDYENCGKAFVNQHNLNSHRRVHSDERNFVCELCGYRSRYREALIVHRRTHTGEKPFACQTCSRCFASKSLLNEHQAMHSTDKPYKCDKCEAAFSRPKALYHHKHLHLGIKKFKCKVCGNAYAQAAGLSAHMRAHRLQAQNTVELSREAGSVEMLFTF